jgi:hypothetical protein
MDPLRQVGIRKRCALWVSRNGFSSAAKFLKRELALFQRHLPNKPI